ncbi:hypothetical protein ACNHYB_15920 [Isoptericola jiangsuensis]|uniref:hypothetical protein n=1 Tax=Isoptericola jiangsuensis TaxID=548579 RepID=UPI003AABD76F
MARALTTLGLDVDLTADPWRYPGPSATTAGLLHAGSFHPLREADGGWVDDDDAPLDTLLLRAGAPGVGARHAVVGIGSNAAPAVLDRKLAGAGVPTTVPLLTARATGLAVGHLPHVNPRGYVAAVPLARTRAGTGTPESADLAVVVVLLTTEQVAALDATEPRYLRRTGAHDVHGVDLAGLAGPWSLYVSRLGAVADDDGAPLPRSSQEDLWRTLRHDQVLAALVGHGDHRAVARRLAGDAVLRDQVSARLVERGTPSTGLESLAPA